MAAQPHQNPTWIPQATAGRDRRPSRWAEGPKGPGRRGDWMRLKLVLGPKPRKPGRGRGLPAQSGFFVARLFYCVGVVVLLEPVHGGLHPRTPTTSRRTASVYSAGAPAKASATPLPPTLPRPPCAPAQIVPVRGAGRGDESQRLAAALWVFCLLGNAA